MNTLSRTTLVLLSLCILSSLSFADQISAAFPSFNSTNIQSFQLNGNSSLVGNVLRLTAVSGAPYGTAFWKNRLTLQDLRSFSAYFTFNISSPQAGGADGIVFAIQNNSNAAGSSGGGIGFENIQNAVGIEFDTWDNGAPAGDPNGNHIGLDLSYWNGSTYVAGVNSTVNLTNPRGYTDFSDGAIYHVWVDYNGLTNNLTVRINRNNNTRPAISDLNATVNLSATGIGPDNYVGFTAATGGASEIHDIGSFFFNSSFISSGISVNTTSFSSYPLDINISTSALEVPVSGSTVYFNATSYNDGGVSSGSGVNITFTPGSGTANGTTALTDSNGRTYFSITPPSTEQNITFRASTVGGAYEDVVVYFYYDVDGDSVPDSRDTEFGNISNVTTTGISNLNVTINGNSTNASYLNTQELIFYDGSSRLMNFTHNFSQSDINFSQVSIFRSSNSIIVNLSGQLQNNTFRKTLYLDDNNFISLCVKEQEITGESQISDDCTGGNETDLTTCIGNTVGVTVNGIGCVYQSGQYVVSNLSFSGIKGVPASLQQSSDSSNPALRISFANSPAVSCPENRVDIIATSQGDHVSNVQIRLIRTEPYYGQVADDATDSDGLVSFSMNGRTPGRYEVTGKKSGYERADDLSFDFEQCTVEEAQNETEPQAVAEPAPLEPAPQEPAPPSVEPSVPDSTQAPSPSVTQTPTQSVSPSKASPSSNAEVAQTPVKGNQFPLEIICGALIVLLAIGILVFFITRKKKKKYQKED